MSTHQERDSSSTSRRARSAAMTGEEEEHEQWVQEYDLDEDTTGEPDGGEQGEGEEGEAGLLACRRCGRRYRKRAALSTHMSDAHNGRMCYWAGCGGVSATEADLHAHFRMHQQDAVAAGQSRTACPWPGCDKSFSRGDSVLRCIKRHNRDAPRGV
ncbi:hypothetical protein GGS20DRAFT_342129 [Poronia punctata]|nr:hypothetical protein GGS20DRAFT_342129 [Poronia punctata]